jgi:hypothetical protein
MSDTPPGPGGPPFGGTASEIREHWDEFMADAEATAEEFEAAGWETLVCHPGDVTVTTIERFGIDVLVPDDEFAELDTWVEGGSFDAHEIYRAETTIVFLLLVMKDEAAERAVCIPAWYGSEDIETLYDGAEERGYIPTYVRNLAEEFVEFRHERPGLLLPAAEDAPDEAFGGEGTADDT